MVKPLTMHLVNNIMTISASVQPLITEDHVEETSTTSGNAIRRRFLEFYAAKGHKILPSSSLVPDDPTVLLTIAGMLQFKPVFLGKVLELSLLYHPKFYQLIYYQISTYLSIFIFLSFTHLLLLN